MSHLEKNVVAPFFRFFRWKCGGHRASDGYDDGIGTDSSDGDEGPDIDEGRATADMEAFVRHHGQGHVGHQEGDVRPPEPPPEPAAPDVGEDSMAGDL